VDSWVRLSNERTVQPGSFLETVLESHSGAALHTEEEFLTHLAELIMQRYEGHPVCEIKSLPGVTAEQPRRNKHHYRRLFNASGGATLDFHTWASETLSLWIEKALFGAIHAEAGAPHSSDPAFDVLSICRDAQTIPKLMLTQVKATEKNVQAKSAEALSNFERLEFGHYDAEISTKLELIKFRKDSPSDIDFAELLYDPERRYRVAVVHDTDPSGFSILTQFDRKVPGMPERRSVCLIRVAWPLFWETLGRKVYEQLS
jgi:hypothetical protein